MAVDVQFNSDDVERLARLLADLPRKLSAKAYARALRRTIKKAETQVVRRAAKDAGTLVRDARKAVVYVNAGGDHATMLMRAGWVPLYAMGGARQTKSGVTVRRWGHHKGAFIARMRSGHVGVFARDGRGRLPISEKWGANPVAPIHRDEDVYRAILEEVVMDNLAPRVVHEIGYLLGKLG